MGDVQRGHRPSTVLNDPQLARARRRELEDLSRERATLHREVGRPSWLRKVLKALGQAGATELRPRGYRGPSAEGMEVTAIDEPMERR